MAPFHIELALKRRHTLHPDRTSGTTLRLKTLGRLTSPLYPTCQLTCILVHIPRPLASLLHAPRIKVSHISQTELPFQHHPTSIDRMLHRRSIGRMPAANMRCSYRCGPRSTMHIKYTPDSVPSPLSVETPTRGHGLVQARLSLQQADISI
jgi:hypothetical protein